MGRQSWMSRFTVAAPKLSHGSDSLDNINNLSMAASKRNGIPHKALFADAERMKKNLRENLVNKPPYDVSMYYKKHGFAQMVARHSMFEKLTLSVITFNALWLWIDADYNQRATLNDAHWVFQAVEFFFCAYFLTEWLFRFLSFKVKCDGLRDPWFVFDSCLVVIMMVDTGVMYTVVAVTGKGSGDMANIGVVRLARLLRLLRMCRMVRLLHAMPEILILIKGMCAAMRSVFFTLCLLLILIYVFGIIFRQLCDQDDNPLREEFFETVPKTMHTLLIYGTFMDSLTDVVLPLENYNMGLLILFYCFLLLAALTVMNMLIGVLCEVVSAVAATEKEGMSICYVQDRLKGLLCKSDDAGARSGTISKAEFLRLLHQPNAIKVLQDVGVDAVGLIDFVDFIFHEDGADLDQTATETAHMGHDEVEASQFVRSVRGYISFQEFVEVVLSLRGGNPATVKDSVELRKYVKLCTDNAIMEIKHTLENFFDRKSIPSMKAMRGTLPAQGGAPMPNETMGVTLTESFAVGRMSSNVHNPRGDEPVGYGANAGVEPVIAGSRRTSVTSQQGDLPTLEHPPAYSAAQFMSFRQAAGQLFDQLVERHEREVAALRDENCRLRSLLELPGGEASKGVPPARVSASTEKNVPAEQCSTIVGVGVSQASAVPDLSSADEKPIIEQPPTRQMTPLSQQLACSRDETLLSDASAGDAESGVLKLSSASPSQLVAWAHQEPVDARPSALRLSHADPSELAAWCAPTPRGQGAAGRDSLRLSTARNSQLRSWCEAPQEHGRSRDEQGFPANSAAVVYGALLVESTEGKVTL